MSTSRVFTVGQVLTAAQMNDLPQGLLGKTTATADVGPTSGTTELDVITAPAVTIAGANRRIRITFHCRGRDGATPADVFIVRIKEGATILAESQYIIQTTNTDAPGLDFAAWVDSPTAASHTYKVTVQRSAGTGVTVLRATASGPMFIAVEDMGI